MKYVPLLYFYIFLLMNNVRFLVIGETVEEDGYHTGRFGSQNGAKQMRVNRAIHESYRPRHKYKAGTGHQGFLKRFSRSNNDGPPCAVMYKNNEPVGILQPYEESYRFLPVRGEPTLVDINPIPVKRNSIVDVLYPSEMDDDDGRKERSNTAGFSDDKYPSVLAKFKIDSRLAKSWSPENYMKRSLFKREQNHEEQPREPANTEIKLEGVAVEDELKTILDDMGLIEDYPNRDVKRAIEDENLELGTNKIDLYKDEHTGSREKRDDSNTTETPNGIPSNTTARFVEAAASRMPQASDKVKLDEIDTVDEKRQVDDANDAAASSEDTKDEIAYEGRSIHETRIERAIRDKIHKLKEEVKKEIDKLRGKTEEKQDEKKGEKKDENKGGKEERKKDEKKGDKNKPYSDDTRRKKRQTFNTLIQEENKDIDPITFNDEDEKIHVRRKRNTDSDEVESSEAGVDVEERAAADLNNDASIDENIGVSKEDNSMSDSYRYDEFEFNNDNDESYEVAGDAVNDGMKTSDTYEKDSCNCDKTSNECKCSIPSLNSPEPSEGHEKSNVNFQEAASADSSKEHCSCDKHGNCRCINSILDNPQPGIDEDYAEDINENDRDLSKLEIDKRDTKQHCSCNKNSNCKCESPLNEQSESQLNPGYSLEDNRGDAYDAYAVETNDDDRETMSKRAVKPRKEAMKNFQSGEYFVDFNPDRYSFSSGKTFRRKRENFEDMVAMHGGGPVRAHLAAIRERSMVPVPRQRSARRVQKEENNSEPRQLIDMSDEDIFGALPQGFEGGLQRYKRVKRT